MAEEKPGGFYAPQKGFYQFVGESDATTDFRTIEREFLTALGMPFYTVGGLIRHFRLFSNLTQRELGAKAGVDFAQICRYEKNEKMPSTETLRSLELALGKNFSTALRLAAKIRETLEAS